MEFEIRLSNENDKLKISEMIYAIYAKELGQYAENSENLITDKYDDSNNYIVAYYGEELVGMVSITKPNIGKISTLNRIPPDHKIHNFVNDIAEVRLLSIKKNYRKRGLYKKIIFKVMQFCDLHNIDRILISAIQNKVEVYQLMGFKVIAEPKKEKRCIYTPMELKRSDFCKSTYYRILDGLRVYDKQVNIFKTIFFSIISILKPTTIKIFLKKK